MVFDFFLLTLDIVCDKVETLKRKKKKKRERKRKNDKTS